MKGNKLKIIPNKLLDKKNSLIIDDSSYDCENLDTEIFIFSNLNINLTNLPICLKKIYCKNEIEEQIKNFEIKLPFGNEIDF